MSDARVTLAEIATATGGAADVIRAECLELGIQVRRDWAGRLSVTVDDARVLANDEARKVRVHEAAWQRHIQACEVWMQSRAEQGRTWADAAGARATERLRTRPFGISPRELEVARQEGFGEGCRDFELRNARPEFNGTRDVVKLLHVTEAEEGSLAELGKDAA